MIIIKGMEMPKSCSVCPFCFGANNICPWTREYATYKGRHADCPLVELPPHGDLIDRGCIQRMLQPYSKEDEQVGVTLGTAKRLIQNAINVPVIVPAERREEIDD